MIVLFIILVKEFENILMSNTWLILQQKDLMQKL